MDGKSSQIKISAIVPTYNLGTHGVKYLAEFEIPKFVEEEYEIIVVDNYILSNTRDVVDQINQKGKEILYVYQTEFGITQ